MDGREEQESFLNPLSSIHQNALTRAPGHTHPASHSRTQRPHWTVILPCMPAPWWGSQ